jgi:hypothetical protein
MAYVTVRVDSLLGGDLTNRSNAEERFYVGENITGQGQEDIRCAIEVTDLNLANTVRDALNGS